MEVSVALALALEVLQGSIVPTEQVLEPLA